MNLRWNCDSWTYSCRPRGRGRYSSNSTTNTWREQMKINRPIWMKFNRITSALPLGMASRVPAPFHRRSLHQSPLFVCTRWTACHFWGKRISRLKVTWLNTRELATDWIQFECPGSWQRCTWFIFRSKRSRTPYEQPLKQNEMNGKIEGLFTPK